MQHQHTRVVLALFAAFAAGPGLAADGEGGGAPSAPASSAPSPGAPAPGGKPGAQQPGTQPGTAQQQVLETPVIQAAPIGRPALQMSSDFGSPTLAIGSYRPVGEVESRGFKTGPVTVRSAIVTGVGYDDNVALAPSNKTSSPFISVAPSVAAGLEGVYDRYYVYYRGNYGRYTSSSVDNFEDHNLGASVANDWSTRFRSLVTYDYLRGHNPRGFNITAVTEPDKWDYHVARGTASYGAEGSQGRIEGTAAYSARRYVTNEVVNAPRDYDQVEVGGRFLYRVAPRTHALVEASHSDINHGHDATLDSTEMRYAVGATWEALAKTRGTAKVGIVNKNFSDASRPDFTGPQYELGVTWNPRTYSTVNVAARRTVSETTEINSAFAVTNGVQANWQHEWNERVRTQVTYVWEKQDLRGLDRKDTYQNLGMRASYALRRWMRVGAEYRHDLRDSTLPGIDYRRNLMLISVEAAI